jgi:hypothetical protein
MFNGWALFRAAKCSKSHFRPHKFPLDTSCGGPDSVDVKKGARLEKVCGVACERLIAAIVSVAHAQSGSRVLRWCHMMGHLNKQCADKGVSEVHIDRKFVGIES